MNVFNIDIEFDRSRLHQIISQCVSDGTKGYVCFVDATMLSIARKNQRCLTALQQSMANSCDGGYIAAMVNQIHHTSVRAYNGPDLFENMIGQRQYRQLLLLPERILLSPDYLRIQSWKRWTKRLWRKRRTRLPLRQRRRPSV